MLSKVPLFVLHACPFRLGCLWVHVERQELLAPIAAHSLDGAQLKVVEHSQRHGAEISQPSARLLVGLGEGCDLLVGKGVEVVHDVHAAGLAEGLAPVARRERVVREVLLALKRDLILLRIDPDVPALFGGS